MAIGLLQGIGAFAENFGRAAAADKFQKKEAQLAVQRAQAQAFGTQTTQGVFAGEPAALQFVSDPDRAKKAFGEQQGTFLHIVGNFVSNLASTQARQQADQDIQALVNRPVTLQPAQMGPFAPGTFPPPRPLQGPVEPARGALQGIRTPGPVRPLPTQPAVTRPKTAAERTRAREEILARAPGTATLAGQEKAVGAVQQAQTLGLQAQEEARLGRQAEIKAAEPLSSFGKLVADFNQAVALGDTESANTIKQQIIKENSEESPTLFSLLNELQTATPARKKEVEGILKDFARIKKETMDKSGVVFQLAPDGRTLVAIGGDAPGAVTAASVARNTEEFDARMEAISLLDEVMPLINPRTFGKAARLRVSLANFVEFLGEATGTRMMREFTDFEQQMRDPNQFKDRRSQRVWQKAADRAKTNQVIALLTVLTFRQARALDPGGRLSDQDFDRAAEATGLNAPTAAAALPRLIGLRGTFAREAVTKALRVPGADAKLIAERLGVPFRTGPGPAPLTPEEKEVVDTLNRMNRGAQ